MGCWRRAGLRDAIRMGGLSQWNCSGPRGFPGGTVWTEFPLDDGLDRAHASLCSPGASASPLGRGNTLAVYFGTKDLL